MYGFDSIDNHIEDQMLNNTVLVAVNNFDQLQYAYPNYSSQIKEFLDAIKAAAR